MGQVRERDPGAELGRRAGRPDEAARVHRQRGRGRRRHAHAGAAAAHVAGALVPVCFLQPREGAGLDY